MKQIEITYDDRISRQFIAASIIFGLVGMLVGVLAAAQLSFFQANLGTSFLSFGRIRPLHTNAVIFAFVGNMIFAGIYYSTQRLLKARMASDLLSQFHFWGWQAIILAAAITLPLGITQGKEYAELEWPIDLAIAIVWVAFAVNFFWTLARRREKQLYVAIWFYIATILTVALLHIVNNLSLPTSMTHSFPVFAGVQGALVQWWYGHNAVAFFLTTPVLGIMYYFLPKAAERPVYSYRLSLVHFWSLIFIYIWAGPHHLLYTALPDWAQSLGMLFSLMLWAPSWGGMLNGLLTLKGSWGKLRTDPVLKFFAAGVTFYGMATFEGPLLSIKSVNALAHYTDWIIGHVHAGALGWNGFMAAAMFYWMVPKLYGTKLYSRALADMHFWLGTFGIILYVVAMWVSGVTQGLMLKAVTASGALQYPSFLETLEAVKPFYMMRLIGGSFYVIGFVLMIYNLWKTVKSGAPVEARLTVTEPEAVAHVPAGRLVFSKPIAIIFVMLGLLLGFATRNHGHWVVYLVALAITCVVAYAWSPREGDYSWHRMLEGKAFLFSAFTLLAVLIGGIVEFVPALALKQAVPTENAQRPYSALELAGRNIYVREGCYTCHSQMVRSLVGDTARYGEASKPEEFIYDMPYQWGSKRTGPDLHRLGGRYPDLWHYQHMLDPRATSPGSNMPSYAFLKDAVLDTNALATNVRTMQALGVPYPAKAVLEAEAQARTDGERIAAGLKAQGADVAANSELTALIAYLQSLSSKEKANVSSGISRAE
ncbi:MAG: cytochrome-c oxidase, cbb3-type subunit I [Deltaproteobacteria bacterium]|nr:cytochrome-c oxidase, cbb3-type subunit I [Deltaproteobacteria bacterium]